MPAGMKSTRGNLNYFIFSIKLFTCISTVTRIVANFQRSCNSFDLWNDKNGLMSFIEKKNILRLKARKNKKARKLQY